MAARVGGLVISRSRSARISPATPIRDFSSSSRSSQRATTVGYVVFAEICSLIQPCRPKNDLIGSACEA